MTNDMEITRMNFRQSLACLVVIFALPISLCALAQERLPEYRLGAGDTIKITVFQNPDLTVETRVTENGTITFPLVGVVRIGGMTVGAAEQTIAKALQAGGFLKQAQVNILVTQNVSNQVSVLGLVNHPGRFPLVTFNTRISEMIATAGGIAGNGADVVILTGTRGGRPYRKEIDIAGMFLNNQPNEDILVTGGDVIYVPQQPTYYIYGEVQHPGFYRIQRGMTVRQALAEGGGPTPRGTERGLGLYRRGPGSKVESLTPDLDSLVQPDDVFYVKESLF